MTYILGGICLVMFGSYVARISNTRNYADVIHEHYAAALYLAMAIICFVCY
jgi:hypothetical protein